MRGFFVPFVVCCIAGGAAAQNKVLLLDSVGAHAAIAHNATQNTSQAITIEFWARINSYSGRPIHKRSGSAGQFNVGAGTDCPANSWSVELFGAGNGPCLSLPPSQFNPALYGAWNHYAVTWSSESRRLLRYVNGVLVGDLTNQGTMMIQTSDPLCFGDIGAWWNHDFRGRLDNIRLWNVQRTQSQIATTAMTVFTSAQAQSSAGLIGSWSFDNGAVIDAKGQNNGVLNNGATIIEDALVYANADCNNDGVLDAYQISVGQYPDANLNGRLDICECTAPAVTIQPVSQSACVGSSVTLTTSISGTAPTLQWRKNGTNIQGATSATYTIASVSAGDAGSYDCVATNSCGTATTSAATLNVLTPQILTPPTDQTVNVDQPVLFVVEPDTNSSCNAALQYQWQRRDPLVSDDNAPNAWISLQNGGGIVGATSPNLVILRPTPGLATGYRCRISGGCGCEFATSSVYYTATVNFSAACPSDFNLDGSVDGDDVITFFERWDIGC